MKPKVKRRPKELEWLRLQGLWIEIDSDDLEQNLQPFVFGLAQRKEQFYRNLSEAVRSSSRGGKR